MVEFKNRIVLWHQTFISFQKNLSNNNRIVNMKLAFDV